MRIVLCYPVEKRHCEQIAAVMPEAELIDAGDGLRNLGLLEAALEAYTQAQSLASSEVTALRIADTEE